MTTVRFWRKAKRTPLAQSIFAQTCFLRMLQRKRKSSYGNILINVFCFTPNRAERKFKKFTKKTDELQDALWNAVLPTARSQPSPSIALVVSGMNDVLNSQGYVQAAWWNRIPYPTWALMAAIALCANVLVGFGMRNFKKNVGLFMIFPFVTSISFFLIADIDSPRGGVIRIEARNLITLQQNISLKSSSVSSSSKN